MERVPNVALMDAAHAQCSAVARRRDLKTGKFLMSASEAATNREKSPSLRTFLAGGGSSAVCRTYSNSRNPMIVVNVERCARRNERKIFGLARSSLLAFLVSR
jgi:hypothetical protein